MSSLEKYKNRGFDSGDSTYSNVTTVASQIYDVSNEAQEAISKNKKKIGIKPVNYKCHLEKNLENIGHRLKELYKQIDNKVSDYYNTKFAVNIAGQDKRNALRDILLKLQDDLNNFLTIFRGLKEEIVNFSKGAKVREEPKLR